MLLENKNAVIYGGGGSIGGAVAHSMAPRANSNTPSNTLLRATPTKRPVANSKPDPTLKPDFSHRGACLSSNCRTLFVYPAQAHRQSFRRNPFS